MLGRGGVTSSAKTDDMEKRIRAANERGDFTTAEENERMHYGQIPIASVRATGFRLEVLGR